MTVPDDGMITQNLWAWLNGLIAKFIVETTLLLTIFFIAPLYALFDKFWPLENVEILYEAIISSHELFDRY